MVVVPHYVLPEFLGGPVAINGFTVDELLQKDPHEFGVFLGSFGLLKQFFDGGQADIVAVVNSGCSEPFEKLVQRDFHLAFFYNT